MEAIQDPNPVPTPMYFTHAIFLCHTLVRHTHTCCY
jgi:hypothetical protein